MRIMYIFLFCGASLLLVGCQQQRILILYDAYWSESGLFDVQDRRSVQESAEKAGIRCTLVEIPLDAPLPDLLKTLVIKENPTHIISSPFFSREMQSLAPSFSAIDFFFFGSQVLSVSNLHTISFDRSTVFEKAGEYCATLSNRDSAGTTNSIGAFFYTGTDIRRKEYEAFKNGWSKTARNALVTEEIGSLQAREKMRTSLKRMEEQGIKTYIFSAAELNSFALELVSTQGYFFITENAVRAFASNDRMIFSIEDDFVGGFALLSTRIASNEAIERRVVFSGLIVPGKAWYLVGGSDE